MMRFLPVFILCCCGWPAAVQAQVEVRPQPGDTSGSKIVQIINADRYGYKKPDSATELIILTGHVHLRQDNTQFFCDSAIYNKSNRLVEAFGHVHINDNDSIDTYSRYLLYHADTKLAHLNGDVQLTDQKSTLYSQELDYDVNQKLGEYHTGGKIVNGETVLTSQEATYYAETKDAYFRNNVDLTDPQYQLHTDSLLYNTNTRIATFITLTHITDSARRKITTRDGYYDMQNRKAVFNKRSVVEDGAVRVVADHMETDDSTGLNRLRGNAVYIDSAQGVSVLAGSIDANREESSFLATQQPLMIIRQDKDSIFVAADTLYSGRLSLMTIKKDSLPASDSLRRPSGDSMIVEVPEAQPALIPDSLAGFSPSADSSSTAIMDSTLDTGITRNADSTRNDSTDRYFKAWYHVRIYSDSLQAVADSLYYSGLDSAFRLYRDPIVWANTSQITGDTIYLFTKNKKADRLYVAEHGMAINKAGDDLFNQLSGNRLYGYFVDGQIDHMIAKGSAQSIYYVKDDNNALIGINKAAGDIVEMRFKNRELFRVVFISAVSGTLFPLSGLTGDDRKLRGFHWYDNRRPKSRFELFGN